MSKKLIIYTLHYKDSGDVIQSGYVPDADCLPEVPKGATITRGFAALRGEERVIDGERVRILRERQRDELIAAIERERDRRLAAGFDYDFGDERGRHRIGTTDADERGWDKVTKLAAAYIASGQPDAQLSIVSDSGPVVLSAQEWQRVLIAKGEFEQPIFAASFALQGLKCIPPDVENPKYWL